MVNRSNPDPAARIVAAMEFVMRARVADAAMLAQAPGWNRQDAWRYLRRLVEFGWLTTFKERGKTRYTLSSRLLGLS